MDAFHEKWSIFSIYLDQWIEAMSKGSKMKGGWIEITRNEVMVTTNKISKVRETLPDEANMNKKKVWKHQVQNPTSSNLDWTMKKQSMTSFYNTFPQTLDSWKEVIIYDAFIWPWQQE